MSCLRRRAGLPVFLQLLCQGQTESGERREQGVGASSGREWPQEWHWLRVAVLCQKLCTEPSSQAKFSKMPSWPKLLNDGPSGTQIDDHLPVCSTQRKEGRRIPGRRRVPGLPSRIVWSNQMDCVTCSHGLPQTREIFDDSDSPEECLLEGNHGV